MNDSTSLQLQLFHTALDHKSHEAMCFPIPPHERHEHLRTLPFDSPNIVTWIETLGKELVPLSRDLWPKSLAVHAPSIIIHVNDSIGDALRVYHGSAMHRWHSIVHEGFKESTSQPKERLLYGKGVYFSTKIDVAAAFAVPGPVSQGPLPARCRCVAVCEVIVDDIDVKEVAKDYVLVRNGDKVRITHLMVWEERVSSSWFSVWLLVLVLAMIILLVTGDRRR